MVGHGVHRHGASRPDGRRFARTAAGLAVWMAAVWALGLAGSAVQPGGGTDTLKTRLTQPAPLGTDDLAALIAESAHVIEGRTLRVSDGTTTAPVDAGSRAVLFVILGGSLPVEDLGLRTTPAGTFRVLRSPATPPRSEIGAKQSLWIDIGSLLPARYEFVYEVPGMGDLVYDLRFD